jgi:hypothetical protein
MRACLREASSAQPYALALGFFCVAKRKGEIQKCCLAHMQTARPLLTFIGMSCPIAPLAIKASLMTEVVAEAQGI